MFPSSTQMKYWTFSDEETLQKFRARTNRDFSKRYAPVELEPEDYSHHFLTPEEERNLFCFYEAQLWSFCSEFSPPMPAYVTGTAMHYFKRFYIMNSIMDYHPREILITCAYLACKIEEFNVTLPQFVANLSGDREKYQEIILDNELLLMSALRYHLTIHNPYRPVEGFFIDIKTRHPILDPETIRPQVEDFLKKAFFTDAPLIYAPSQVALAAILHGASRSKQHLDSYVTEVLITEKDTLPTVIEAIRNIRLMVRSSKPPPGVDVIRRIEEKLDKCRNQENNPENPSYRHRTDDETAEDELEKSFQSNVRKVPSSNI